MKIRSITLLSMLCGFVWSTGARADDPPSVVFVVGEGEYRSEWSMTAMADLLERDYGFETTVLIDQRLQGRIECAIRDLRDRQRLLQHIGEELADLERLGAAVGIDSLDF